MSETKKFIGWLKLNYRTGKIEYNKRYPKTISGYEIPIKLEIDIIIPENPTLEIKGEVEMTQTQMNKMIVARLTGEKE